MTDKHTPGPWTLRGKRLDVGTDAYCVASDWGGSNWKNDARLIAAAPELLAALRMICDSGVNLAAPIERAMLDAIAMAVQS